MREKRAGRLEKTVAWDPRNFCPGEIPFVEGKNPHREGRRKKKPKTGESDTTGKVPQKVRLELKC